MSEVAKKILVYGAAGIVEASYAAGGAPALSDAILLDGNPEIAAAYANDGTRAMPPGTTGFQPRAVPTGLTGSGTFKVRMAGGGAAYSTVIRPRAHNLLRAAGFDATLNATVGAETWTYSLTAGPTGYGSGAIDVYSIGQKRQLTGVYSDFEIGADGSEIPLMQFALHGLLGLPTDIAVPALVYDSVVGPKSVGATLLTLGTATGLVVRKWSLKLAREISPRLNVNTAAGHAGFSVGKRAPTLDVTVEATALAADPYTAAAGLDPYRLFSTAKSIAWALAVGSVQFNQAVISGPAAQLAAEPKHGADGPTATWDLSFQLNPSAIGLNDELTLVQS